MEAVNPFHLDFFIDMDLKRMRDSHTEEALTELMNKMPSELDSELKMLHSETRNIITQKASIKM